MMEVSNKTITLLILATIVISLGGTYISISAVNNRLTSIGLAPITGFATVPNATAIVTITGASSIQFSAASIDFGSGSVDLESGATNCTLSSTDATNSGCLGFSEVSTPFTIENDGNTNLSVTLRTNVSPNAFIGIDSALFLWNVTVNEPNSCRNTSAATTSAGREASVDPNTTISGTDPGCGNSVCGSEFENVSTTAKTICPRLLYTESSDTLNIDINISIPLDAPLGTKLAGFIVTGTREPTS